jgi:hypothetical protein
MVHGATSFYWLTNLRYDSNSIMTRIMARQDTIGSFNGRDQRLDVSVGEAGPVKKNNESSQC